jgi:hypothetical protein
LRQALRALLRVTLPRLEAWLACRTQSEYSERQAFARFALSRFAAQRSRLAKVAPEPVALMQPELMQLALEPMAYARLGAAE